MKRSCLFSINRGIPMKMGLLVLLTHLIIFTACHKKTLPVITERAMNPSLGKPDTTMLEADSVSGRMVFTSRCSRCHGLPETIQYTPKRWETIISLMAPRARLNRQETFDVLAYVKMNAKK